MTKREIRIEDLTLEQLQNLFGVNDSNINLLELRYKTTIAYKNNAVYFEGDDELENELTGVINALVDYILETNNNILARNLIEKIGATLVRENIETAFDALNYLSGFNKKVEVKEAGSAEILKENAVKEEANNDDIWEKMKEFE